MIRIYQLKVGDIYTRKIDKDLRKDFEVIEIDHGCKTPRLTIKEVISGKEKIIKASSDKVILLKRE